ncbi:unnamed protein product [Agarophyton chilense]|eukprot:gb/GEZJ01002511.1/.p1 GENE.gb/GEZJ01002511.1/~~gb/GEZJ01002511.1/.p1  ORF type:complete len:1229 (+),score=157.32 gb/GEZJ01002511.1/:1970-5656(+)
MRSPAPSASNKPLSPPAELPPPPHASKPELHVRPIPLSGNLLSDELATQMATTTTLPVSPSVSNQTTRRRNCKILAQSRNDRALAQSRNTPNGAQSQPPSKRRRTGVESPSTAPLTLPPSVNESDIPTSGIHRSRFSPHGDSQRYGALSIAPDSRTPRGAELSCDAQTTTQVAHKSPVATSSDANDDKSSPNNAPALTHRVRSEVATSEDSRPALHVQSTPFVAPKDTRRIWNRRSLESSGLSANALQALKSFMNDVPPIPIQPDHNRRQTRNMRGWIQELEKRSCNTLWDKLMEALRTDTSPQRTFGDHWDHDVCRFVLGHVVSENQTSQTRQAMNNAIKRELICPTESGNSTRGKTFRDLFREKCHEANVKLNPLEDGAHPKRSSHTTFLGRHSSLGPLDLSGRPGLEYEDFSGSRGLFHMASARIPDGRLSESELKKLRESCPHRDEWGQTAWWKLECDEDVKLLPELLVAHSLYELRSLLIDFRWVMRMFRCVNFSQGMYQAPARAYDVILRYAASQSSQLPLADVESFRLIRNAIMVILPVLYKQKARPSEQDFHAHLATQLTGRLLFLKRKFPTIACLIQSIELFVPKPWLKPLTRCFRQPRTDIALAVPSEGIFVPHQLVLSDDGKYLVTTNASTREQRQKEMDAKPTTTPPEGIHGNGKKPPAAPSRGTLPSTSITVWEVASGKRVGEVLNIPGHVNHVAITKDNNCIIGETFQGLYFWHFEKGENWTVSIARKSSPRVRGLSSIRAATNPELVLTTHKIPDRPVIVLWNTKTGLQEKEYDAVESKPNCIDIYSKRQYFASGHDNGFIHLWNWKDDRPILTFKNEGEARGAQNGVSLSDANKEKDSDQGGEYNSKTISISFFERENDLRLASISSNHTGGQEWIRIWLLPPKKFLDGSSQAFVSCKRAAVWQCKLARQVFCSVDGNLFTGGDDGVARMWELEEDATWKGYTIEKDSIDDSNMSSTFICCGKKTKLIATYVTKSPYVVVWDTRNKELRRKIMTRTGVYKPYIPMEPHSVDVADMDQYQFLKPDKDGSELGGKFGNGGNSGQSGSRHQLGSKKLWYNPKFFFLQPTVDSNSVIRPGELQPWLHLKLERSGLPRLHVCFDQPVTSGVTGLFVNAPNSAGGSEDGNGDGTDVLQRRGMAIKLEDKCTELFEVEGKVKVGTAASGTDLSESKKTSEKGVLKGSSSKILTNEKEVVGGVKEVSNAAAKKGDVSSVT